MVGPMAHVVREQWNIGYRHSYGRSGSALMDLLASRSCSDVAQASQGRDRAPGRSGTVPPALVSSSEREFAGTVTAFASLKSLNVKRDWRVVACIDFGQYGTIFGQVVAQRPWTSRTIRSQMKIGQRVAPVSFGPDVRSFADIVFVVID